MNVVILIICCVFKRLHKRMGGVKLTLLMAATSQVQYNLVYIVIGT